MMTFEQFLAKKQISWIKSSIPRTGISISGPAHSKPVKVVNPSRPYNLSMMTKKSSIINKK
jgi:hypothetical protein